MAKETIYIEADDEITTVIDKVISAKNSIVAVVLPKRATVFQSVVNMKLLKKVADEDKKKVVLITSDDGIITIASVAGIHVAKSLNSKPILSKTVASSAILAGSAILVNSNELDPQKDLGNLENTEPSDGTESEDPIEIDNTSPNEEASAQEALNKKADENKKKKTKIPDFSDFRVKLAIAITAVILLIVGWVVGFVIMPKATVTINTDTSSQTVAFDFTASTRATSLDIEKAIVPAKIAEVSKENKITVPATGEKNVGEKASGQVTMSAEICNKVGVPGVVVAGTGISANGRTYITLSDVSFTFSSFNDDATCLLFTGGTTSMIAQSPGTDFNISTGTNFSVSGRSDVTATGGASGGTDEIVKIVSQEDINKAKEQLKGTASADALNELREQLAAQQLQALDETITESNPKVRNSPSVGAEAKEVTVTQTIDYELLGVSSNDLNTILNAKVQQELTDQVDKNIRDNGLGSAVYRLIKQDSANVQKLNLETIATIGPDFDEATIAQEVAGKKRGEIEKMLESREGVRSVSVDYSPMWVTTTPKSADKITIIINEVEN